MISLFHIPINSTNEKEFIVQLACSIGWNLSLSSINENIFTSPNKYLYYYYIIKIELFSSSSSSLLHSVCTTLFHSLPLFVSVKKKLYQNFLPFRGNAQPSDKRPKTIKASGNNLDIVIILIIMMVRKSRRYITHTHTQTHHTWTTTNTTPQVHEL